MAFPRRCQPGCNTNAMGLGPIPNLPHCRGLAPQFPVARLYVRKWISQRRKYRVRIPNALTTCTPFGHDTGDRLNYYSPGDLTCWPPTTLNSRHPNVPALNPAIHLPFVQPGTGPDTLSVVCGIQRSGTSSPLTPAITAPRVLHLPDGLQAGENVSALRLCPCKISATPPPPPSPSFHANDAPTITKTRVKSARAHSRSS
jgi:hypothetical protein